MSDLLDCPEEARFAVGRTFCIWCCRPIHYAVALVTKVPNVVFCGRSDCGHKERKHPTHAECRERMAEYFAQFKPRSPRRADYG